jgi:hypothetical protein
MLMTVRDEDGGALALDISAAPEAVAPGSVFEELSGPIVEFVRENPGCSLATVAVKLGKKRHRVSDTIRALLEGRTLVDSNEGQSGKNGVSQALYLPDAVPAPLDPEALLERVLDAIDEATRVKAPHKSARALASSGAVKGATARDVEAAVKLAIGRGQVNRDFGVLKTSWREKGDKS